MSKIKFLIVEDEAVVALDIKTEIEKLDGEVTAMVNNEKMVLKSIQENEPDIIMMDIVLGKNQDGINIAKEIHKTKKIPILYITAFSDDKTMKRAYDTNPIGYIVKPYKIEDLTTNIRLSQFKLNTNIPSKINKEYIDLGEEFYFDKQNKNLYFKDNFIKLGIKEKLLLSILVDANHMKVQFSDLEEAIWDGHKPSSSALRTLVYRLKGKMGNNIIQVVYGYGYYLKPIS
ncbi:MAG: DNA-binding response regulator [Epsilonproteobacteria bacterium]|nr:MAG: DNA-binding response regulator [Campylobacterota bacterium]